MRHRTPEDIMHMLKTRLTCSCATADEPIRDIENDLDHTIDELDDIQDSIEEIQEEVCDAECTPEHRKELNTLLTHIRAHIDEAHYMLRNPRHHGSPSNLETYNKTMEKLRERAHKTYMAHHDAHIQRYGHHDLALDHHKK